MPFRNVRVADRLGYLHEAMAQVREGLAIHENWENPDHWSLSHVKTGTVLATSSSFDRLVALRTSLLETWPDIGTLNQCALLGADTPRVATLREALALFEKEEQL